VSQDPISLSSSRLFHRLFLALGFFGSWAIATW